MQPQRNSLAVLVNPPVRVEFGGYAIEVTPLTTRELFELDRVAGHVLPLLGQVGGAQDLLALFADHGEALMGAVAIAGRLDLAQVELLPPDEFCELALGLIEVNADFFVPRLSRLAGRVERTRARLQTTLPGPTPSPGS